MYCLPAVVRFKSLLFEAIHGKGRKNDTSVLLSDYTSNRATFLFLIETFEQSGTILFTCFSHLLQIFCFDYHLCEHFRKRAYFCAVYHGTIIRTGITCMKIPCYMRDSACRWFIVENAKIFRSYVKHF